MENWKRIGIEAFFVVIVSSIGSYLSYRFAISESNNALENAIKMKKLAFEYEAKKSLQDQINEHNKKIEESYINISKIFGQIKTALYKSDMQEVEEFCNEFEKENAKIIINCKDTKTREILIKSAISIRQLAYSYEYATRDFNYKERNDLNTKLVNYFELYLNFIPKLQAEINLQR